MDHRTVMPYPGNISGIDEVLATVITMIENSYYGRVVYKDIFPLNQISSSIISRFYSACDEKKPTVIFSDYVSPVVLTYIFISMDTNIEMERLSSGNLYPADFYKLTEAAGKLYNAPLSFKQ